MAFEASQLFKQVTALDASARFISPAIELQKNGLLRYQIKDEGELSIFKDILIEDLKIKNSQNLVFMQDDVMKLKEKYRNFDVIVALNLLEELRKPKEFLSTINERFNKDGLLFLGSTYQWQEAITKKENWLGGFKKDGEPIQSIDGIQQILSTHFELIQPPVNLSYVIRNSSRKLEVLTSELSIWKMK